MARAVPHHMTPLSVRYRVFAVWLAGVGLYAGDFFVKWLAPLREPVSVEIGLDQYFPFVPAWAWVYLIGWLLLVFGMAGWYLWERRMDWVGARQLLFAAIIMQIGGWTIHYLLPTYMPRPEIPSDSGLSVSLMRHIFSTDPPTHVLPSLHIASVVVACWYYRLRKGSVRLLVSFAAVVSISLSVLYTKQHGVLDVPTGIVWGYIAAYAGYRLGAARADQADRPADTNGEDLARGFRTGAEAVAVSGG